MAINFCPDCGLKLPKSIDDSGKPARFCPNCGYSLTDFESNSFAANQPTITRSAAIPLTGLMLGAALGAHYQIENAPDTGSACSGGFDSSVDFGGFGDFGGIGGDF